MRVVVKRNSGSTLTPTIYKTGGNAVTQGLKMQMYPAVFAPVLATTDSGYFMPELRDPTDEQFPDALDGLRKLWASTRRVELSVQRRNEHHNLQIMPICATELRTVLDSWYARVSDAVAVPGISVNVVHGDATTENWMLRKGPQGRAVWIDPSVRAMPLEAEFDVAKLLQSYFGYNAGCTEQVQKYIREFVRNGPFNADLLGYYLVTHLVRLYRVQPQARRWALDLVGRLDREMEDLCK